MITDYQNLTRKRFRTLFIPYVAWNLICVVWIFLLITCQVLFLRHQLSEIYQFTDNLNLLKILWAGDNSYHTPFDCPLWFIRDLIILVCISPLIYHLINFGKKYSLPFFLLLYIFNDYLQFFNNLDVDIYFFIFGCYFGITKTDLTQILNHKHVVYLCYFILLAILVFSDDLKPYLQPVFKIIATVAIFTFAIDFNSKHSWSFNRNILRSCFTIYALHYIIVLPNITLIFNYLISRLHLSNSFMLILLEIVLIATTVATCVVVDILMWRFSPKLAKLLTGTR